METTEPRELSFMNLFGFSVIYSHWECNRLAHLICMFDLVFVGIMLSKKALQHWCRSGSRWNLISFFFKVIKLLLYWNLYGRQWVVMGVWWKRMNSDELKVKASYDFSRSVKLAEWKKVSRRRSRREGSVRGAWAWTHGAMVEEWCAATRISGATGRDDGDGGIVARTHEDRNERAPEASPSPPVAGGHV